MPLIGETKDSWDLLGNFLGWKPLFFPMVSHPIDVLRWFIWREGSYDFLDASIIFESSIPSTLRRIFLRLLSLANIGGSWRLDHLRYCWSKNWRLWESWFGIQKTPRTVSLVHFWYTWMYQEVSKRVIPLIYPVDRNFLGHPSTFEKTNVEPGKLSLRRKTSTQNINCWVPC